MIQLANFSLLCAEPSRRRQAFVASRIFWVVGAFVLTLSSGPQPVNAETGDAAELGAAKMEAAKMGASWITEGPGPMEDGQVEGITDREVVGAINSVAAHPTDADILYAGAVNGGIWKTTNATTASVTWTRQTDDQTSLSMGTVDFDPTDATHQTLVAGVGRFSSLAGLGGDRTGLLRTTDGGATWAAIDGGMAGRNIVGVAPRGATIVAAVNIADSFSCGQIGVWRSTDTGVTWGRATGIPLGAADALASDPTDATILYASVVFAGACDGAANGIYKSTDTGANWSKVSNGTIDALLSDSSVTNVDIAVGTSNNVFVAIIPTGGSLGGVFRSGNGGTSWTTMDLPGTMELPGPTFVGIHAGSQGGTHSCLAADPTDSNVVYIGGDRQPRGAMDLGSFPNAVGASDFSGRLFRGDASASAGSQFTPLTHSGTASNSAPHADSRDLAFDANGNLIESDDGGIYKRTSPATSLGDWFSINGDIQTTEAHDLAYDSVADILQVGNQDTGTAHQILPGNVRWDSIHTGDGGDVLVDNISTPGFSVRYSSFQNLSAFRRRVYNASNVFQSQTFPALTVIGGGAAFTTQFVTPLAINHVDGLRLIFGGGNSVYESTDQGDTISEIGPGIVVRSRGRNAISAGATGNADVLYVGGCIGACTTTADGLDGVFVRTTGGGSLSHSLANTGIQGVAGDPDDPSEAFAIDVSSVYYTANTGTSWSDVTGNLGSFSSGVLRSIEIASDGVDRALVVGADRGIYMAPESSGFATWSALGTGLPNAPVWEIDYSAGNDTLFVGTLGRGSFSLEGVFAVQTFLLDVTLSGTGSGSVSSAPAGISCPGDCSETYDSGTSVTLTPTPTAGSVFTQWQGDADCLDGSVTMTEDLSCEAVFSLDTPTLSVAVSGPGSGSVSSAPAGISCPGDCTETYDSGTSVTLTPSPAAGSVFTQWQGDADCLNGSVTMTEDLSCEAVFSLDTHTLSVTVSGTGSGSVSSAPAGISCPGDCTETYDSGTSVTLTPTPASGSVFLEWLGDTDCLDGSVTMTEDLSCEAVFGPDTHTLTVTASGTGIGGVTSSPAGIFCPVDCEETYDNGTTVTLTADPVSGSVFSQWLGDADCLDGVVTMTEDLACEAVFSLDTHILSVSVSGAGSGVVTSVPTGIACPGDCEETYDDGTSVSLVATPLSGSVFMTWLGDADCLDGSVSMFEDLACEAVFAPDQQILTVTLGGSGSGSVTSTPGGVSCPADCTEDFAFGTSVVLDTTPNAGSVSLSWTGDSDCLDGIVVLEGTRDCTANFALESEVLFIDGFESGDTTAWSTTVPLTEDQVPGIRLELGEE